MSAPVRTSSTSSNRSASSAAIPSSPAKKGGGAAAAASSSSSAADDDVKAAAEAKLAEVKKRMKKEKLRREVRDRNIQMNWKDPLRAIAGLKKRRFAPSALDALDAGYNNTLERMARNINDKRAHAPRKNVSISDVHGAITYEDLFAPSEVVRARQLFITAALAKYIASEKKDDEHLAAAASVDARKKKQGKKNGKKAAAE